MRKLFYILLFAMISFSANAQFTSDLVVFNSTGEFFKAYIGNTSTNNVFTNKVCINDLQAGHYTLNVVFQNPNIPDLNKDLFLPPNTELACALRKNDNGIYYAELFEVLVYANNSNNPIEKIKPMPPDQKPPEVVGGVFCNAPMTDEAYAVALETITNQSFDGDKLTIAKQIVTSNCLLATQVKEITKLFDFETSRLEFTKYAYTHTFDPNNYFIINDVFDFSSSIKKLNDYINSL